MSNFTETIREKLMATNQDYRRLHEEHSRYAALLDQMCSKTYLNEQEKMEEVRLKKLKLRVKDQMEELIQAARTA